MRVGIVSDVHGRVPDSVKNALQGCDQVLCTGDMQAEGALSDLESIAPTTAIRGNTGDEFGRYKDLPLRAAGETGGVQFFNPGSQRIRATTKDQAAWSWR